MKIQSPAINEARLDDSTPDGRVVSGSSGAFTTGRRLDRGSAVQMAIEMLHPERCY